MSLRSRLLVASLVLVAVGLLAADFATYSALRLFLLDRVDNQLAGASRSVEHALFERGGSVFAPALQQLEELAPGVYVQVRDSQGHAIVTAYGRGRDQAPSSPRLPTDPHVSQPANGSDAELSTTAAEVGGPDYRVRVTPIGDAGSLVVALPLDETNRTLHRLLAIEIVVTVSVLAVASVIGAWLVRLGLRPLSEIETTAGEITAGDTGRRVGRADERTEVGRVGRALNVMLDRIDVAFAERRASEETARASEQRMRRFVGDASHELRTPLAAVRAYAELYRRGAEQHPEDLARLLGNIEKEAARMGLLVDDLLLLTRLDEGRPLARVPVDLGAVATDGVAAARVVDPDRRIDLDVVGSVEVLGDQSRLRQVVDNLLANVRSHTAAGTPASVRVAAEDGWAVLSVADAGPGMSEEAMAHAFERFYRADPSRSRDAGGAGLGLSIVAAIAAASGGSASAAARLEGGTVVTVRLPLLTS